MASKYIPKIGFSETLKVA